MKKISPKIIGLNREGENTVKEIENNQEDEKEQERFAKNGIKNMINLTNALNDKDNFGDKEVKYWIYKFQDFVRVSIAYEDFKMINYWFPMKALYLYDAEHINEIVRAIYALLENNPRQIADRRTEKRTVD